MIVSLFDITVLSLATNVPKIVNPQLFSTTATSGNTHKPRNCQGTLEKHVCLELGKHKMGLTLKALIISVRSFIVLRVGR